MKKEEIPQDKTALGDISRELCYVKNNDGTYDTALSTGWDVKKDALDNEWNEIHERVNTARLLVEQGLKSPIYFHMEKNIMDISLLSDYVGYNRVRIWWHMRPSVYKNLSSTILERYAKIFNVPVNELHLLK